MEVINTNGRRKTSIARIYLQDGNGKITVNNKDVNEYFPTSVLQYIVNQPLALTKTTNKFDIKVNLVGGGSAGQAEALRLAISKALVEYDPENRSILKAEGLLTRNPRMVERKKFGQKKARKRFQFSKR